MLLTVCLVAIATLMTKRTIRAAIPSESLFAGLLVLATLIVLFQAGRLD